MELPFKTEKRGDCWVVIGSKYGKPLLKGYSYVYPNGVKNKSHIFSFEFYKGSREGKLVLHTCDNKWCCNPDHLYLGDKRDNTRDLLERHGEAFRRKLSDSHIARFSREGEREKMAKAANCRWSDPEQRRRMSERMTLNNPMKRKVDENGKSS